MTKHTPVTDENALLKCHITVEDVGKASSIVSEVVDKNTLALGGTHVKAIAPVAKGKLNVTLIKAKIGTVTDRLGKVMHMLYDLESGSDPERSLNIDLGIDLYQMEDY